MLVEADKTSHFKQCQRQFMNTSEKFPNFRSQGWGFWLSVLSQGRAFVNKVLILYDMTWGGGLYPLRPFKIRGLIETKSQVLCMDFTVADSTQDVSRTALQKLSRGKGFCPLQVGSPVGGWLLTKLIAALHLKGKVYYFFVVFDRFTNRGQSKTFQKKSDWSELYKLE